MRILPVFAVLICFTAALFGSDQHFDVVIYGATASGTIAAIAAATEGVRTVLVDPGRHLGGMVTGGLGRTDMDRNEWTGEAGVQVFFTHRIMGVVKRGSRLVSMTTTAGNPFNAQVFIDSFYEGDPMKAAGVSYAVGREGRDKFGESVAGRQDILPAAHQFRDLQENRQKYDSVTMGGYNVDIREVQWIARDVYRFPNVRKEVLMEGYVSMPVQPWQIPFRALLPRRAECSNLLVTATISASTIAYASFRMEPQYMIAGRSAGVAAAQAIQTGATLYHIDLDRLQRRLREQKQILKTQNEEK